MKISNVTDPVRLRKKIQSFLKLQGFEINPHLRIINTDKDSLKKIQSLKRKEQLRIHKKSLQNYARYVESHLISGKNLNPANIELHLIEIKPGSLYSKIFFWWNLVWWSIPYTRAYGRQMRYLIWDRGHNAPFGLICLQSPPLGCSVRDSYLGIKSEDKPYWVNQSLYAQRVGALPPYNELIGGKMVSLTLTANEIRDRYAEKYKEKVTLIKKRILPNRLLFITTTSAFGKSSVYERIKYNGENVTNFIGYTEGAGTFHISEILYSECLDFLKNRGVNIKRGFGTGPQRKLRLIAKAFKLLKLPDFEFHNIKRGFYIFPNVKNLHQVISEQEKPIWHDRPFKELEDYWKKRWGIPRSKRTSRWKEFDAYEFYLSNLE